MRKRGDILPSFIQASFTHSTNTAENVARAARHSPSKVRVVLEDPVRGEEQDAPSCRGAGTASKTPCLQSSVTVPEFLTLRPGWGGTPAVHLPEPLPGHCPMKDAEAELPWKTTFCDGKKDRGGLS